MKRELTDKTKVNQLRHMKSILSLEGSLLTKEQKADIMKVTYDTNIIEGFERIEYWKEKNRAVKWPLIVIPKDYTE